MQAPPPIAAVVVLALLAILPALAAWLAVLVPSRRTASSGCSLGSPASTAPLAPVVPIVSHPLVHLTRSLSGADIEGYILGMRHLPVEKCAPLLARCVNGRDPALQLYAQGILQQGRDDLAALFHKLQNHPPDDPRTGSWLLETGLRLAHPSLCGPTERPGFLKHLALLAADRLQAADPSPALLANAARVFLEADLVDEAEAALAAAGLYGHRNEGLAAAVAYAKHKKEPA